MISTILLVEDDPTAQFLFRMTLETAALNVAIKTVNNGAQALYYLQGKDTYADRENYPLPSAILTDINMPHVSGIELLAWIKQQPQLQHIPVFVMSSIYEPDIRKQVMELGAASFFDKLSPTDQLIHMIRFAYA